MGEVEITLLVSYCPDGEPEFGTTASVVVETKHAHVVDLFHIPCKQMVIQL